MGDFLNLVYDVQNINLRTTFPKEYLGIVNVRYVDIDEIVDELKNEKLYYFYWHSNYITHQVQENNGLLPFSEKVINLLKENENFNIIFYSPDEFDDGSCVYILNQIIEKQGLRQKQFYLMNWNQNLVNLKTEYNSEINCYTLHKGDTIFSKGMGEYHFEFKPNKKYIFSCYNRAPKSHRLFMLAFLKKMEYLDYCDWTWLRGEWFKNTLRNLNEKVFLPNWAVMSKIYTTINIEEYNESLEYIKTFDRKTTEFEDGLNIDVPPFFLDWGKMWEINTFNNSYINIINESNFEDNGVIGISEKSFIPFYFQQIPIFVASKNHVKTLREKHKLDLFDDIIDHSYDNEEDNGKRFLMITKEIERIFNNKEKIIEFYKNNECRLALNKNKILLLTNNWKKDQEYFLNLINK